MGIAIGWFACAGYTVCVPLTDSQHYDLVVDDGVNGLQRVSVKTATGRRRNDSYVVGLRTIGSNSTGWKIRHFDGSLAELLFVACDNGDRYVIPTAELTATNEITLSGKYEKYRV
jgi:PD-(D/E)XK endonuclease